MKITKLGIGVTSYDHDRYGNRIRKFVVTKMVKERVGDKIFYTPVWHEVEGFEPERGVSLNKMESAKGKVVEHFVIEGTKKK